MKYQRTLNVSDNVVNTSAEVAGEVARQHEELVALLDAQLRQIGGGEGRGCF